MKLIRSISLIALALQGADDDYLHWDLRRAQTIALAERVGGKVGGSLDFRGLHTERSFNYKLRATWLTPDVIRACGRIEQLTKGLSARETQQLIDDANVAGETVFLIEIDPNEGSGIIPSTWSATLSPVVAKGKTSQGSRGVNTSSLSDYPALRGGARRDYDYDVFWMVFRLQADDGKPLFAPDDRDAELFVQINGKIGKVRWRIPDSIRSKVPSQEYLQ